MLLQFYGDLMPESEPEKRATRRFALRLPVAVTYSDNGSQQKSAQTRDVSARYLLLRGFRDRPRVDH